MVDTYRDYWGNNSVEHVVSTLEDATSQNGERQMDPVMSDRAMADYWGSAQRGPMPLEPMPDVVPWTIATVEETAEQSVDGVAVTGVPEGVQVDVTDLPKPSHDHAGGRDELGYGQYGADAPFIPSAQQALEQKIVIAVAEKIVADQRALLVQVKTADNAHFESWPFAEGQILTPPVWVGTRHPNGIGYLIVASAAGLYVGENQSVGQGNLGIPVPTGTQFLSIPANCDLWVSSAGEALAQATSLYIIQLYMGATTL